MFCREALNTPNVDEPWLFRLTHDRFYVRPRTGRIIEKPLVGTQNEPYRINNGQWIYCVVTYDSTNNRLRVILQTVEVLRDGSNEFVTVDFPMTNADYR